MDEEILHLKLSIRCLCFVGVWPLKLKKKSLQILYSVLFTVTMTVYTLVVVTEFIELLKMIGEDLEKLSFQLGAFLFHVLGLAKLKVLNGRTVRSLLHKITSAENNILNGREDFKRIYIEHVEMNHLANKIMMYMGVCCYILFTTSPYFTDLLNRPEPLFEVINNETVVYKARPLPLPTWFPFDRYKHYSVSYTWHVIVLSLVPPCIVGLNTFFYGLIIFAIGQLKILQLNLGSKVTEVEQKPNLELTVMQNLKSCILHHKFIISYVTDLSSSMKTFVLLDFVGCGLHIAVIGFQVAVMEFSPNLVKTVWYLLTMLPQLFLFYWFANDILLESANVANAIWNSKWYTCNKSTKRTLLLIMIRAQKPLTLSVGPFYYMSTETLVSIMRIGYSYAMLMRRVYTN